MNAAQIHRGEICLIMATRGRPQMLCFTGLAPEISGVQISVMLNSVNTSTPKRSRNACPLWPSGTMNTMRNP